MKSTGFGIRGTPRLGPVIAVSNPELPGQAGGCVLAAVIRTPLPSLGVPYSRQQLLTYYLLASACEQTTAFQFSIHSRRLSPEIPTFELPRTPRSHSPCRPSKFSMRPQPGSSKSVMAILPDPSFNIIHFGRCFFIFREIYETDEGNNNISNISNHHNMIQLQHRATSRKANRMQAAD